MNCLYDYNTLEKNMSLKYKKCALFLIYMLIQLITADYNMFMCVLCRGCVLLLHLENEHTCNLTKHLYMTVYIKYITDLQSALSSVSTVRLLHIYSR